MNYVFFKHSHFVSIDVLSANYYAPLHPDCLGVASSSKGGETSVAKSSFHHLMIIFFCVNLRYLRGVLYATKRKGCRVSTPLEKLSSLFSIIVFQGRGTVIDVGQNVLKVR
jgi:hypothetical protein